jgi:hypothetical protein
MVNEGGNNMQPRRREAIVFEALNMLGREVAVSQWWQDLAFRMYDDAAYDDRSPDAGTLARWLEERD